MALCSNFKAHICLTVSQCDYIVSDRDLLKLNAKWVNYCFDYPILPAEVGLVNFETLITVHQNDE